VELTEGEKFPMFHDKHSCVFEEIFLEGAGTDYKLEVDTLGLFLI